MKSYIVTGRVFNFETYNNLQSVIEQGPTLSSTSHFSWFRNIRLQRRNVIIEPLSGSMAQSLSTGGSTKTMRAQGLWFEARPDRTLSPGSGQKMGSPWT